MSRRLTTSTLTVLLGASLLSLSTAPSEAAGPITTKAC
jgi:hypothetical protein